MDEVPVTAENMKLSINDKYQEANRNMLRKHEDLWLRRLGRSEVTENRIDRIPNVCTFKYELYLACPRITDLEQFEIRKQLAAAVIEQAVSEWVAPLLFDPKKDDVLRLFVYYRKRSTMTIEDSYPLPRWINALTVWEKQTSLQY